MKQKRRYSWFDALVMAILGFHALYALSQAMIWGTIVLLLTLLMYASMPYALAYLDRKWPNRR